MFDSVVSLVLSVFSFPPVEYACGFAFVGCLFCVLRNFVSGRYWGT